MKEVEVKGHESSLLPEGKEWKLVWNDEFDGKELDRTKWTFRLNFWGAPFAAYTGEEGVSLDGESHVVFRPVVKDGRVCSTQLQTGGLCWDDMDYAGAVKTRLAQIEAGSAVTDETRVNPATGKARFWPLNPLEAARFKHRYGYYEARVKFQKKPFWWSAFWMQSPSIGAGPDPRFAGVENDIIECFTSKNDLTCGNIYNGYAEQHKNDGRLHFENLKDSDFHRVGMEWSPAGYVFYFDGKEISRSEGPVSEVEEFLLLTTEVHGYRTFQPKTEWTEEELADTFVCDYVRVFDEVKA